MKSNRKHLRPAVGIALYGIAADMASALEVALKFFPEMAGPRCEASYATNKGGPGYIHGSVAMLREAIRHGRALDFSLSHIPTGEKRWTSSFNFNPCSGSADKDHPHQRGFIACTFHANDCDACADTLSHLGSSLHADYAIMYCADKSLAALDNYAAGENFISLYPYEDPTKWRDHMPSGYGKPSPYRPDILRMVYPFNLLRVPHLESKIDGACLRSWIAASPRHGTLKETGDGLWLWSVDSGHLEEVNAACGKAGLLLSWREPIPGKLHPAGKLP